MFIEKGGKEAAFKFATVLIYAYSEIYNWPTLSFISGFKKEELFLLFYSLQIATEL